jgi:cleavage and polyadenylation specificity factor subunit 1
MKLCNLEAKVSNILQRKTFLVVGTAFLKGEDYSMRGRVLIFDVIEVVPEPGRPETNHKLKLLVKEEVKGAVSAVTAVNGYLCVSIGPKAR